MSQPKVIIDEKALLHICDRAQVIFVEDKLHEHRDVRGMQAALMVKALRDYLISQGVEPPFTLALKGECTL